MDVICEIAFFKRNRIADYVQLHRHAWPSLVRGLREGGIEELYIYLLDTILVVVMKREDFRSANAKFARSAALMKWGRL